jgi:CDP-paratose 2-epimerase
MPEEVLITGGCGFVGSHLALALKRDYPNWRIVVFDNLHRRGSELNLVRLAEAGVEFIHGDIRNKGDLLQVGPVSVVIEAAAEPSVLSGIDSSPDYVIETNLYGTLNCLQYASRFNAKFIFLSTSRVYPILELSKINYTDGDSRFHISDFQELKGISTKGVSELFPSEGPRSFYGSSKYASELFIREYIEFNQLPAVINRCGVLTGPWQMGKVDQGVVVLWMARHYFKGELSYIGYGGSGHQVRDILHISDLYRLIKIQLNDFNRFSGEIFNVGGGLDVSVSLHELTDICERITGNRIDIKRVKEKRSADIPVYITDNSKINETCGWLPEIAPESILSDVFDWIRINEQNIKKLLS